MNVSYRYLTETDIPVLETFFEKSKTPKPAKEWMLWALRNKTERLVVIGEFVDEYLNGIVSGCTLSFLYNAQNELAPIWLAMRVDRLNLNPESFTVFMEKISRLLTLYFERLNYFSFYIVRRLPRKDISYNELAEMSSRGWAMKPYTTVIERVVRNKEDYDKLPLTFKKMIGEFITPVLVLFCTLDNEYRQERSLNNTLE